VNILLAIPFGLFILFVLFVLVIGRRTVEPGPRLGARTWIWWLALLLAGLLLKVACGIRGPHPDYYDF